MQISRIDLSDIHAPKRMAQAIHDQLQLGSGPVQVLEIAKALDIDEVRLVPLDGVEGMLLAGKARTQGAILANVSRGMRRARFTVAHELGHFLLERHQLSVQSGFRCAAADMRETREGKQHILQETQANQFAIGLLAPARLTSLVLSGDVDLQDAQILRDELDISLKACVRRMVEVRSEPLAAVWSRHGRVRC